MFTYQRYTLCKLRFSVDVHICPCFPNQVHVYFFTFPIHVSWESCKPVLQCINCTCCNVELVRAKLQFICCWQLTSGTVVPICLIAVAPTVLEESVFHEYLSVAFVSLGLATHTGCISVLDPEYLIPKCVTKLWECPKMSNQCKCSVSQNIK